MLDKLLRKIDEKYYNLLKGEIEKPYFKNLDAFLEKEYKDKTIYPPKEKIFNALKLTKYEDVKVVILGQDPYHGKNQAMGLSFSVEDIEPPPPSLKNIFKEINRSFGEYEFTKGSLIPLAKQGVLLLNTVLTVEEKKPNSHKNKGWEIFTDEILKLLNNHEKPICFMLWGNFAIKKGSIIDNKKHLILTAPHPSPLSFYRGFLGCNHFLLANKFLKEHNRPIINWQI